MVPPPTAKLDGWLFGSRLAGIPLVETDRQQLRGGGLIAVKPSPEQKLKGYSDIHVCLHSSGLLQHIYRTD